MTAIYFASAAAMRAWFEAHHDSAAEVLVGFHKRHTGRPTMTWPESVDVALCFGWIDGVRRSVDADRYTIRFTPRRPGSTWSAINVRRMAELERQRLVTDAGRAAFARRTARKSGIYSYEQRTQARFSPATAREFRAHAEAWAFFAAQPPGYRRLCTFWVMSAKKEETRASRLARLIEVSGAARRIDMIDPRRKTRAPGRKSTRRR